MQSWILFLLHFGAMVSFVLCGMYIEPEKKKNTHTESNVLLVVGVILSITAAYYK